MSGRRARKAIARRLRFERENEGDYLRELVQERRRILSRNLVGKFADRVRRAMLELVALKEWRRAKVRAQLSKRGAR